MRGHRSLAADLIEDAMKRPSSCFAVSYSKFHLESLTKTDKDPAWSPSIKEASVKKKADMGMTPMHLACINPCSKPLEEVYNGFPNLHLADQAGRKPVHYAAVCEGTGPLKFILEKGGQLMDATKQGATPLHLACIAGRISIYCHFCIKLAKKCLVCIRYQKVQISTLKMHFGGNLHQKNVRCRICTYKI